ncbi:MAG: lytic murein transglycosylase [Candidatus Binatia bacterium]
MRRAAGGVACGLVVLLSARAACAGSWDHLTEQLVRDGVPRAAVRAAFGDPRMPRFDRLEFSLAPRESRAMYRGFLAPRSLAQARACRARYDAAYRAAEARFGVRASVLSALLHVETHCGTNTGREMVLYRLARLAMADEPANVRHNITRHTRGVPRPLAEGVAARTRRRARELAALFYPEVLAVFRIAGPRGLDPLAMRGSGSGAFGFPQFLPSSYLRFGVDGDGDGIVSLYDPTDAIFSAANYLAGNGWRAGMTHAAERRVIWTYNRSDAYIDTVLTVAERVEQGQPTKRGKRRR